ncbi:hypothetical protein [Microbispora sp. NPDC046933]|uniref:hypothetical protein n=1 Tax=Microbispora sp. NPDC046933 TaxID=3155618 RepID=UPI0033D001FA
MLPGIDVGSGGALPPEAAAGVCPPAADGGTAGPQAQTPESTATAVIATLTRCLARVRAATAGSRPRLRRTLSAVSEPSAPHPACRPGVTSNASDRTFQGDS